MRAAELQPVRFVVRGEAITEEQFKATAEQAEKTKRSAPDSFHKGWRVMGHSPEAIKTAEQRHTASYEAVKRMQESGRGGKAMDPWSEDFWRKTAKKKPVRSKPYEIPQSASECAALAKKAGWLDVEVVEVKRGDV